MAKDTKKLRLTDEIATAAKDIDLFAGWLGRMENPDPVLRSESSGKGLKLYDEIARDAHAASVLQTRYLAVVGKEWEVIPPETGSKRTDKKGQETADFVKTALSNTNFDQWRQELLQGILYGFYTGEVIWGIRGGNVVPLRIRCKHPRRFVFTPERELRLLTPANMVDGEPVPDRKFVVFTSGSSDNPYGCGLGQKLWFPVWFKKHGIKYWLTFLEKFGMPTTIGKYPPGADPDQQKKLMDAMKALQSDTAIKVPNTVEVDLLEASRTGQASYEGLCDFMDRQISKAVLGQTLTTEVKGEGSYAASQTHDEVRGDIVKADADLLCECLNNSLIPWIVNLNFDGVTEYPKLWIRCEEEQNLKPLAERDEILTSKIGLKVPTRYFHETYGIPEPEGDEETIGGKAPAPTPAIPPQANGQPAGFAEGGGVKHVQAGKGNHPLKSPLMQSLTPDQQVIERLKTTMGEKWEGIMSPIVAAAAEALGQAADLEDAKGRLQAAFNELDDQAATELIAQALFAADAWGRINA